MKTKLLIILLLCLGGFSPCFAEPYKITAYCSCSKCCGKSNGITASGHKLKPGDKVIACNWLPFGYKAQINGEIYTVEDRGARSQFGSKKNHIKHFDVWQNSHQAAKNFGVKYLEVKLLDKTK